MSLIFAALLANGCSSPASSGAKAVAVSADEIAPGIAHRAIPTVDEQGIDLIDVDLNQAHARIVVATDSVKLTEGAVTGNAFTPHEWLDRTHALAAANGGYFGMDFGMDRKEFVGLLVQNGRARHIAPPLHGRGGANTVAGRYVRSAFGIMPDGRPDIAWAATDPSPPHGVWRYRAPDSRAGSGEPWNASMAVGCGPMLIHDGKSIVSDRQERLVSPGQKARTFVAYDGSPGHPRHFVLGMASGITYQDLAAFLIAYFPHYDKTRATAAMCLDGGSSTQLSYRLKDGQVESPRETGVAVPDAILVVPK